MKVTEEDIKLLYELLLGRLPESKQVIEFHRKNSTYESLVRAITSSEEYRNRLDRGAGAQKPPDTSPFWHYHAEIDALKIIEAHEDKQRVEINNHSVNYLGVAVNVDRFLPGHGIPNGLDNIPIPANWHADMAEFAAALRAVELSGENFTMIELGCGWGCWMNNTGAAARKLGKKIMLIGVEGDEDHASFAHESMSTNRFSTNEYKIVHGIASASSGFALFPKQETGGVSWGSQPIFNAPSKKEEQLIKSGKYVRIPMVALADVIAANQRIDLLHIDIQGGEVDVVEGSLDILSERVAYILIGTHSREIDGRLMKILLDAGWALEIERPCIFSLHDGWPTTLVDGVQGWRNRRMF